MWLYCDLTSYLFSNRNFNEISFAVLSHHQSLFSVTYCAFKEVMGWGGCQQICKRLKPTPYGSLLKAMAKQMNTTWLSSFMAIPIRSAVSLDTVSCSWTLRYVGSYIIITYPPVTRCYATLCCLISPSHWCVTCRRTERILIDKSLDLSTQQILKLSALYTDICFLISLNFLCFG